MSNNNDKSSSDSARASKCPVALDDRNSTASGWKTFLHGITASSKDSSASINSLEEAAQHPQTPSVGQQFPLGTNRQVSSIPRGKRTATTTSASDDELELPLPAHQRGTNADHWEYPSEQQLYNAMKRKGWSNVPEDSIPTVLQIHNNINERTWRQIQQWEGSTDIRLARFQGRPRDMTPKAFLQSYILRLYDPPFDRHDWYVQDNHGKQHRYVIDYYYLPPPDPHLPPIPFVDARPALDEPRALWMRCQKFVQEAFPGIARRFNSTNNNNDKAPAADHHHPHQNTETEGPS